MPNDKWDVKLWVITILLGIALSIGTYNLKTMATELNEVKGRTETLTTRQAVDDERFAEVKIGFHRLELHLVRLEDLIEKTHPRGNMKSSLEYNPIK
jgi:hypothetical protein